MGLRTGMKMAGLALALGGCAERGVRNGLAVQDTGDVVLPHGDESCEDRAARDKRTCAGGCELVHGASCVAGCNTTYSAAIHACNGEVLDAGAWQQPVATPSQKATAAAATKNAALADRKPGGWPLAGY